MTRAEAEAKNPARPHPESGRTLWAWDREDSRLGDYPACLPADVFDKMTGGRLYTDSLFGSSRSYDTEADARADLSAAVEPLPEVNADEPERTPDVGAGEGQDAGDGDRTEAT